MSEKLDPLKLAAYDLRPDPDDPALTEAVTGLDQSGESLALRVVKERALTLYLNEQEILTLMTLGAHPRDLARGYLANQNMLEPDNAIETIEHEEDLGVLVVRTARPTRLEERLRKRTQTSGCAQGTVFGELEAVLEALTLPQGTRLRASEMQAALKTLALTPSLYLSAGAIHGCALVWGGEPRAYVEDVGRHNAVDVLAGYAQRLGLDLGQAWLYTTGRLTSEMVIKTALMGVPILVSRSGFTASGVALAREKGMTLVGRAKGVRFQLLSAPERLDLHA